MRFFRLALVASVVMVGACGGGDDSATSGDTAAGAGATSAATTPAATPTTGGAAAAPATGTTHEVQMVMEGTTYKFVPENITIKQGDAVKWTMVSGAPHNVAFDPAKITDATAKSQLTANMPNQMSELSGPMLMKANETYTVSFAGVPAGTYDYFCTPHIAMNMVGRVTVTP